jgi:hypothetical protein
VAARLSSVIAGLDPAIHVFLARGAKDVDTRVKPAHDRTLLGYLKIESESACRVAIAPQAIPHCSTGQRKNAARDWTAFEFEVQRVL